MAKPNPARSAPGTSQSPIIAKTPKRSALLASTAFTGAFIAVIAGHPGSALAACAVTVSPNTVTCDNTVTGSGTNVDTANPASTDRNQAFNTGSVTGAVNTGQTVSGYGLQIFANQAGADLTMTNNGAVTTNQALNGLVLGANGGTLTYLGNGSASNTTGNGAGLFIQNTGGAVVIGSAGAPVTPNFSGTIGLLIQTGGSTTTTVRLDGGALTATAAGGSGMAFTSASNGNISATLTGNTAITQTTGGANNTNGIFAVSSTGSINLASDANIGTAGAATSFRVGLRAQTTGTSSLNVSQTGGAIFATGWGINAVRSGSGDVTVNTAAGSTISSAGFGISAQNQGAGNTTVIGAGNLTAGSIGIIAEASGGNVLVASTGTIAATTGIQTTISGSGTSTVNISNDVTAAGGAGNAIETNTVNGLNTVNVTGGTIRSDNGGIEASSTGTGGIRINMTGGQFGTAASRSFGGISAFDTGSAGDVTITSTNIYTTGSGVIASLTSSTSGNVAITTNGVIDTVAGDGISAANVGAGSTGSISIVQNGAITAGAGGNGVITRNDGSGTTTIVANAAIAGGQYGIRILTGANNSITNNSSVSGNIGVRTGTGTTTLTNNGSITGTGGTAVQLGGANNLFVMNGPGAALTGSATGSGSDTFRFSGGGANTFDVSQIGSGWSLLDKQGSSNWTLTGTSTYAGPVTVNGGTLSVNGNLASASNVTVASGAMLGGNGTLPSTTINAGGTLSPGNSIGLITVNGNLVLGAGAIYRVEVSGASADRTNVTGTATLGGTVQVTPLMRLTTRTTYTILAAGTLGGAFASAAIDAGNNFARNPLLSYVGNDVLLTLDPGLLSPALIGGTPNQRSVAAGIDNAITAGSPLTGFDPLFGLSAAALPGALDQLSGEVHASTAGALVDESQYVRSAILGRLRQASYGGDASTAALAIGGPQTAFADGALETALAYAKSPIVTKAPVRVPQATSDIVFWSQGFGAWGKFNADGNAAALSRDLAGFVTGFDARFGNWRGGIAAGYTGSRNNTDGRGSANVDTGHIAAYGGVSVGALNLRAGGAYAFHTIDTDRTIAFPGFFDRATAHYQGGTGQIFGEAGYGFAFGKLAVEPFAGAAWVRLDTDGFSEKGGVAALNVAANSFEVGYSTLGVRAASLLPLDNGMVVIPRASAAWQHAFNSVTPDAVLAFAAAPASTFTIAGVPIARDALLAEAGLDLALNAHATVGVSYTGQIASNVADHAAKGKFSWKF